jgi:hypothetical protein
MQKTVLVIAALAAAMATQAAAKDLKTTSDVSRATQMTDAQMDQITAGTAGFVDGLPPGLAMLDKTPSGWGHGHAPWFTGLGSLPPGLARKVGP